MPRPDAQRIRSYLELISGKGNEALERILDTEMAQGGLEGAQSPTASAARGGAESFLRGRDPSEEQLGGMEALIIPKLRPAIDVIKGSFTVTHRLWTHLANDAAIRKRIEDAIPLVGRIELPGNPDYPYGGTGFLVGDGLLMTNRHVAMIFSRGLGNRGLDFKPGARAGIDFLRERGEKTRSMLPVKRVVLIHPYWDMAILAVDGLPAKDARPKLSLADPSDLDGREIAVIGYPAFDPRNDAAEQDALFDREYGVKRLQPGQLHRRADTESFGKIVSASAHDCSTLGGNSGSVVVDLDTGEIVALHFGGLYQKQNFAVPAFELARDGRVVDSGVDFAGKAAGGAPPWGDWWAKADLVEAALTAQAPTPPDAQSPRGSSAPPTARALAAPGASLAVQAGAGVTIEITVQLGVPAMQAGAARAAESHAAAGTAAEIAAGAAATTDSTEALATPWFDDEYDNRGGYYPDFLGSAIPMPQAADKGVVALTRDGEAVLHYEHFSIVMHAKRRLALITASNVSADPRLRRPDQSRSYTRKALSGLGENDQERWVIDKRMDEAFQLPDAFFTRDRKAFDKGHIVRRDDVAYGTTYDELRRANGDTYHVTNCSPQTADFNRSAKGVENWGDLENHVLSSAKQEKLTLFAGPVLGEADPIFVGVGDGRTTIRARIPECYWKVVVSSTTEGLAAFGFVLEQDLSDVAFEYVVAKEFAAHMRPLSEIEAMAGVIFPAEIRDADQYDTVRGADVAMRAGARRKRRRSGAG